MTHNLSISVREIDSKDIDQLMAYWYTATAEYLEGMGADKDKLPVKADFIEMLQEQIRLSIEAKKSYALIWEMDNQQIGHSNVNNIIFGKEATMHLHLWQSTNRKKGMGVQLVKKSLPYYFNNLKLEKLICEPYALNPAPNKTLKRVGFQFVKRYTTIPGSLNFEQEVNR